MSKRARWRLDSTQEFSSTGDGDVGGSQQAAAKAAKHAAKGMDVSGGGSAAAGPTEKEYNKAASQKKNLERKFDAPTVAMLLPLLAILALSSAQITRDLAGALFITILVPSTSKVIKAMLQAGKAYSVECKKRGKGHDLGPPSSHVFHAMIEALQEEDVGGGNKLGLIAMIESEEYQEHEELQDAVQVCRVSRCWEATKSRVTLAMSDKEHVKLVARCWAQVGGERKHGAMPRSHAERQVQRLLSGEKA